MKESTSNEGLSGSETAVSVNWWYAGCSGSRGTRTWQARTLSYRDALRPKCSSLRPIEHRGACLLSLVSRPDMHSPQFRLVVKRGISRAVCSVSGIGMPYVSPGT